jgi:hypothetical protein
MESEWIMNGVLYRAYLFGEGDFSGKCDMEFQLIMCLWCRKSMASSKILAHNTKSCLGLI